MYRHRLRPPGGARLTLNGRSGVSGSIGNLFTKALGALAMSMRGLSTVSTTGISYQTTAPVVPVWSAAPVFTITAGDQTTQVLPVTAPGYPITLTWVSPGSIASYPWITLNSGLNPSITFDGTQVDLNDISGLLIDATANGTTIRSPAGGSITVNAASANVFFDIPSLADEQSTYASLGWTGNAPSIQFASAYTQSNIDVHNDTEGDDLWTWTQQVRRGYTAVAGHPKAAAWRNEWLSYYKNGTYRNNYNTYDYNYDQCHTYGWGLCLYGAIYGDSAAIAEAEQIGQLAVVELSPGHDGVSLPSIGMGTGASGGRGIARMATLFTWLAEVTTGASKTKWTTWRDRMIDVYMASPDWKEAPFSGIVQGGAYFGDRDHTISKVSNGAVLYDAGLRMNTSWQYPLHAEFLWRAYLATGRSDVRNRLVKFARFIQSYGHNLSYTNPGIGSYFGVNSNGTRYGDEGDGNSNNCYDASVINILTWGYKLTGDSSLLNRARIHLRQATRWPEGGPNGGVAALVGPTGIYDYIDTRPNPDGNVFTDNKGQLQHCYALFQNGGSPSIDSTSVPQYVQGLSSFQSRELIGTYAPSSGHVYPTDPIASSWKSNGFSVSTIWKDYGGGCEDRTNRRIWFSSGGHAGSMYNGFVYFDANPDANGKPNGWYELAGSASNPTVGSAVYNQWTSFSPTDPMADGRPAPSHNYYSVFFCPTNNRVFKFGQAGGQLSGGGGGPAAKWFANAANTNVGVNPCTKLTDQGPSPQLESFVVLNDPISPTKALYSDGNTTSARFYNMLTNAWGNTVDIGGYHRYTGQSAYAYDSIRGRAHLMFASARGQFDINWSAESVSNVSTFSWTGSTPSCAGNDVVSFVFDPDRYYLGNTANVKGVFWLIGGRTTASFANITEVNPVTHHATNYAITGTAPRISNSVEVNNQSGAQNCVLFEAFWRVLFVASAQDGGVFVIKLPSAVS